MLKVPKVPKDLKALLDLLGLMARPAPPVTLPAARPVVSRLPLQELTPSLNARTRPARNDARAGAFPADAHAGDPADPAHAREEVVRPARGLDSG